MRFLAQRLLEALKSNFLVYPVLLAVCAIALSYLTVTFDQTETGAKLADWLPAPAMKIDGARLIVSTIASGMITVAALVFSLTFVAITQLSQQLGPRILLIFMKDAVTKIVLGVFLAVFIYSLLVLSTIGTGEKWEFVPLLSVYTACLIALGAFGLVVYFVHHIATTMQADVVVAHIGSQLDSAFEKIICPPGNKSTPAAIPEDKRKHATVVDEIRSDTHIVAAAIKSGYIQLIDFQRATSIADDKETEIAFLVRPGHFVVAGTELALATAPADNSELADAVRDCFVVGERRTPAQHAEFETNALIEVALRAMSPGINDPFTAIACIDHLLGGLVRFVRNPPQTIVMKNTDGRGRVYRYPQDFEHFMKTVFHPLRFACKGFPMVLIHLAKALKQLADQAADADDKRVIALHATELRNDAKANISNPSDSEQILKDLANVIASMEN